MIYRLEDVVMTPRGKGRIILLEVGGEVKVCLSSDGSTFYAKTLPLSVLKASSRTYTTFSNLPNARGEKLEHGSNGDRVLYLNRRTYRWVPKEALGGEYRNEIMHPPVIEYDHYHPLGPDLIEKTDLNLEVVRRRGERQLPVFKQVTSSI